MTRTASGNAIERPPLTAERLIQQGCPKVTVVQYAYRVDWGDGAQPRFHHVNKSKRCDCALGGNCPSVQAVKDHLVHGGERAPDYPADFWPAVPEQCPVCQSPCAAHSPFNFNRHGIGWVCTTGGALHYWEARAIPIKRAVQARKGQPRWVIPPVCENGGDMQYPGVSSEDIEITWAKAWAARPSTQEKRHMKGNRVIRVPSLMAFVKEVPPVGKRSDGKAAVVRLAACEMFLPQRGKSAIPRKSIGLSLQSVNEQGEVVWMHESHVVLWFPDGPGFGADRAVYNGVMDLKDIVRDHLASLGYDVREGDYALSANLQPLNTHFECAKWVKVSEQEWKVEPVNGG